MLCFHHISRVRGLCGCRPSQADCCIGAALAHAPFWSIDLPLFTTVSKLQTGNGLVRISAGMVGILLNSCYPRVNSNDLHLGLGFVLRERRREFEQATVWPNQNC